MVKKSSPVFSIVVILLCSAFLWPQSIFETSSETDIPLLSGSAAGLGISFVLGKNINPLTPEDVALLNLQSVPCFDRWACKNFSSKADKMSDIFLNICALSPLLMFTSPNLDKDHRWTYALMYLETEILTYSITEITKCLTGRIRPYVYNPNVFLQEKLKSPDVRKSFFSGHTSISFANVVFLARTFSAFHPDSRWRPVIWCTGLSAATLTGVLRILSGKHFPTDVLMGALVGSIIGAVIPKIHGVKPLSQHDSRRSFQVSLQFSF